MAVKVMKKLVMGFFKELITKKFQLIVRFIDIPSTESRVFTKKRQVFL